MVPPSQGWFDVIKDRRGSDWDWGSAVGERAIETVRDRAVGERTKSFKFMSAIYHEQYVHPTWGSMTTYQDFPIRSELLPLTVHPDHLCLHLSPVVPQCHHPLHSARLPCPLGCLHLRRGDPQVPLGTLHYSNVVKYPTAYRQKASAD